MSFVIHILTDSLPGTQWLSLLPKLHPLQLVLVKGGLPQFSWGVPAQGNGIALDCMCLEALQKHIAAFKYPDFIDALPCQKAILKTRVPRFIISKHLNHENRKPLCLNIDVEQQVGQSHVLPQALRAALQGPKLIASSHEPSAPCGACFSRQALSPAAPLHQLLKKENPVTAPKHKVHLAQS